MLRFFNRFIYGLNIVFVFILLATFLFPYLAPSKVVIIPVLSLGVPIIILINIVFCVYWLIQMRSKFLLSLIAVGLSVWYFNIFPTFSNPKPKSDFENSLKVMSYNVRLFNAYEKEDFGNVTDIMNNYIATENPDIICIQEYFVPNKIDFSDYPYKFIYFKKEKDQLGYAIFSKYPLQNTGAFDFSDSNNNTIYTDIIKENDTLRLYNMHLQSHGVISEVEFLQETSTERLLKQLNGRFRQQETQVKKILSHKAASNYPVLFVGDFNNTPYSYSYNKLMRNMKDPFREAGSGLGTTFSFQGFPMRIDFILTSPIFETTSFKVLDNTFSDHRAIVADLSW